MFWLWVALVTAGSALALLFTHYLPRWRLRRALARPFPAAWLELLQRQAFYRRLPAGLREELQQHIKRFLHEKSFVGCERLQVTNRMRVLIAAQACLLLLNRPSSHYAGLRWIYLYPGEFRSRIPERDAAGVVSSAAGTLAGVSWDNGRVVLAWDSVYRGMQGHDDGYNVVLHEFAHQLDQEDGSADGAPLLYNRREYDAWSQALGGAYEALQRALEAGETSVIDPYGATHPAEFFAVVTELFYERPRTLRRHDPGLYRALRNYYRVDPESWGADGAGAG